MNEINASLPTPEPAPAPQPVYVRMPSTPTTVTFVLIGVTVAMYLLQMLAVALWGYAVYDIGWLEVYGARINESIRAGELWRFITPVFLHGSVAHIFFNMYALFNIGSFLERQFGHGRFILLYFLSGLLATFFPSCSQVREVIRSAHPRLCLG
jgi:rhomboid protease GluP